MIIITTEMYRQTKAKTSESKKKLKQEGRPIHSSNDIPDMLYTRHKVST